jgi:hypothetical protein
VSADHENDSVRDSVIRAAVGAERAGLMASQESVLRVRAGTTMTPEDLAQLDVLCSWAEQRLPDLETHLRRFAEVINVSATTGADQGAALLRSTATELDARGASSGSSDQHIRRGERDAAD